MVSQLVSRIYRGSIQPWLTLSCQLLALIVFSLFAFSRNPGMLLAGNDGPTSISLADIQQSFFGVSLHLHGNMLEGLGNNIPFPWNLSVIPAYWLRDFANITTLDIAVLYCFFAVMLFLSVLLIAWNYRFPARIRYPAALCLTLLSFPYFESFRIYSITASTPLFITMVMIFAVMDVGIQNMGVDNWFKTFFYGAVFLLGLVMGLVICPASLMLIAPALLITTVYSFINVRDRAERTRKLIMLSLLLILTIMVGWMQLFLGLILNTAASFFGNEMVGITHELIYSSILFQHHVAGMTIGIWLFCGCTLGCWWAIRQRTAFRALAIAVLAGQLLIAGGGAIFMSLPEPWAGPSPVYCEIMLFPFYALFCAYFIAQLVSYLPLDISVLGRINKVYLYVILAIISVYLLLIPAKTGRTGNYGLIPATTAITEVLERNIAIREHSAFRGRVANIIENQGWLTQLHYFSQMNVDIGNDHQTTGLWLKHIPTLHEYNQLISPGFYSVYRRFLSDSLDAPYRSWSNFNQFNVNILRLLGVRYILSTKPAVHDAMHRVALTSNPTLPALHLFELKQVNTAGISATQVVTANTVREAEAIMAVKQFDLRHAIVAPHVQDPDTFVSATHSQLTFEKGGIHLQAQSKGKTLLILPIEFSHCLHVTPFSGDKPAIIRVDVALAGVVFNRKVDILIDTRTGLLPIRVVAGKIIVNLPNSGEVTNVLATHFLDSAKKQGGAIGVGLVFFALISTFHLVDPYQTLFFSHARIPHLLHILGRLLFCAYLLEILFALGQWPLGWLRRSGIVFEMDAIEEIVMSILCGSAILRVLMLVLGFATLYDWRLLAVIGTVVAVFGWPRCQVLCQRIWHQASAFKSFPPIEKMSYMAIMMALMVACTVVVVEKYLFPNGTGDYFSHYFPYYKLVISTKNIFPNDVWYHFYISKGVGDVFFTLILSDLLGSSAVSCAMFFAGLLLMFSMMHRITHDGLIALAATAITATGFIWTFDTRVGFTFWAEFPKQHVISAVLFFGCVWASWRLQSMQAKHAWPWALLTSLVFMGLIILRPQFATLCILLLGMMATWALLSANVRLIRCYIVIAAVTTLTACLMLAINYQITGLAEVTPFRFFWQHAHQARFAEWVSPFLMLLLDLGSSPDLGSISPPNFHQFPMLKLIMTVFRLDRAAPMFIFSGIPFACLSSYIVLAIMKNRLPHWQRYVAEATIFAVWLVAAILVFFSVNQIGSLFRLYMFCMFPVIALTLLPFAIARSSSDKYVRAIVTLLLTVCVVLAVPREIAKIPGEQKHLQRHFAKGKANIADAFTSQNAVWKEGLQMASIVGYDVPIWSTQVGWHFCVAPGCNIETFFSFSMNKDWAKVMFESPDIARAALQQQGINYFAFDTSAPIFDLLPYSPLFTPQQIAKQFGLVWSGNGVYLLTWRSPQTKPIPADFFAGYQKSSAEGLKFADFPTLYQRLADVYHAWQINKTWPITLNPNAPRPRGWQ